MTVRAKFSAQSPPTRTTSRYDQLADLVFAVQRRMNQAAKLATDEVLQFIAAEKQIETNKATDPS